MYMWTSTTQMTITIANGLAKQMSKSQTLIQNVSLQMVLCQTPISSGYIWNVNSKQLF